MNITSWPLIGTVIIVGIILLIDSRLIVTVEAGHVGVAALFGEVQARPYEEGLHVPVNPLYKWTFFDTRQKTLKETASVPSQDQLQTRIDASVQYRIIGSMAPSILKETGSIGEAVSVHLLPTLRSLLREQGKSIKRAEDFFLEDTQEQLQSSLEVALQDYLKEKGIEVQAVLIRDINLPVAITRGIEAKKTREQDVEKQKAELERVRIEMNQKVVAAEASRAAAEEEAEQRRVLADAQAYEINKINEAIASNPAYLQLQALEALKEISEDPSTKLYFLDGESPMPLPLMNIGDPLIAK